MSETADDPRHIRQDLPSEDDGSVQPEVPAESDWSTEVFNVTAPEVDTSWDPKEHNEERQCPKCFKPRRPGVDDHGPYGHYCDCRWCLYCDLDERRARLASAANLAETPSTTARLWSIFRPWLLLIVSDQTLAWLISYLHWYITGESPKDVTPQQCPISREEDNDPSESRGRVAAQHSLLFRRWCRTWPRIRIARVYTAKEAVRREKLLNVPISWTEVTTVQELRDAVTYLANLPADAMLGIDMEASNLDHLSPQSYLQIKEYAYGRVFLIDLMVLQTKAWRIEGNKRRMYLEPQAWTTTGQDGITTLKTIFEDPKRKKLIWDVRQDSCCLYGQSNVRLAGALDVQYACMLAMETPPARRPGLIHGVEALSGMTQQQFDDWKANKTAHMRRPQSSDEPCHSVWSHRPVPMQDKEYAVGDVRPLRTMYDNAVARLNGNGVQQIEHWTDYEVRRTQIQALSIEQAVDRRGTPYDRYVNHYFTIRANVPSDFARCWDRPLLRPGQAGLPGIRARPEMDILGNEIGAEPALAVRDNDRGLKWMVRAVWTLFALFALGCVLRFILHPPSQHGTWRGPDCISADGTYDNIGRFQFLCTMANATFWGR